MKDEVIKFKAKRIINSKVRKLTPYVLLYLCTAIITSRATAVPCRGQAFVDTSVYGAPSLKIEGKKEAPILFFGNNQFGRDQVLVEELELAVAAGVRIISFNIPLSGSGGASAQEVWEEIFQKFTPKKKAVFFFPRIYCAPPDKEGFAERYPQEIVSYSTPLSDAVPRLLPSVSSKIWMEQLKEQFSRLIKWIYTSKYAERVIGICLLNQMTGEWYYPEAFKYPDYSTPMKEAFTTWALSKYGSIEKLRKAWNKPNLKRQEISIPSPEARNRATYGYFLDPAKDRCVRDYHRFLQEATARAIIEIAKHIKDISDNRLLVRVFYGYTFEPVGCGPGWYINCGHQALGKVLESTYIDIINSPHSYGDRHIGLPGLFHQAVDSIALHNKIGIFEDDTFTHLSEKPDDCLFAPGFRDRTENISETIEVVRRNFLNFASHCSGDIFMDLLSDGRWRSEQVWDEVKTLRKYYLEWLGRKNGPKQPDVAVVTSETATLWLKADSHKLLLHSLYWFRSELARTGLHTGYYLISDLDKIPESARMLVFLNPYEIIPEEAEIIRNKWAKDGRYLVWIYAADIIGTNGLKLKQISPITGFDLAMTDKAVEWVVHITARDIPCWKAAFGTVREDVPSAFYVRNTKDIEVLGKYIGRNEVAFAVRDMGTWKSVFCGVPRIPESILRYLGTSAGATLYEEKKFKTKAPSDGIYIGENFVAVHTSCELGKRIFGLPERAGQVWLMEGDTNKLIGKNIKRWEMDLAPHRTYLFKIVK
jgi:hypothetical protein